MCVCLDGFIVVDGDRQKTTLINYRVTFGRMAIITPGNDDKRTRMGYVVVSSLFLSRSTFRTWRLGGVR